MIHKVRFTPALLALTLVAFSTAAEAGNAVVKGGLTGVLQQEIDSGADDASLSGDLFVSYPTAGGSWFLYIEGATGNDADSVFNLYPEVNGDANSVQDRNGRSHLQVSELYYRFNVGGRSQLLIGHIDTSAQIDRSRIANDENTQFLGTSFVNNPTIAFPDYTLGILYRQLAIERRPELTLIVSSSDGIADNPGRSYSELVDIAQAGKGLFASASARWFRGAVEYGAGVWLRTDDHPLLDDATRNSHKRGAYAVYGFAFGAQSLNLRAGVANAAVSHVSGFAGLSYEYRQPRGTFGLGVARIFESERARTATSGDTDHIEAWYRVPVIADHLHITADIQFVRNPGFDASGTRAEARALLAALRFDYVF
ncbi:MAG: carbohydrate porin [Woeseia sp.]